MTAALIGWWSHARQSEALSIQTPAVSSSEAPRDELVAQVPNADKDNATPAVMPSQEASPLPKGDVAAVTASAAEPLVKPALPSRPPAAKSKQRSSSVAAEPTDPVFGLPVQGAQSTKR